jgi:hypothetical protein
VCHDATDQVVLQLMPACGSCTTQRWSPYRLAQLKANVIITQDQCRVCAVSEPQLREAVEAWASSCQVDM